MIRFSGLSVICNLSQYRSSINIHLRTFVNLVIFPLSLFSDLGPVWPAHDISTFWDFNALQYVPVYVVFHSGIAPISLVENDAFSHIVILTSRASPCEALHV